MAENEIKTDDQRIRICFKTTAKGEVQPDITVEAGDTAQVKNLLNKSILTLKEACYTHGFIWLGKDPQEEEPYKPSNHEVPRL